MLGLREYLQSYQGIEMLIWENQEGLVEMAPNDLPEVLSYCLSMEPRPTWLTHVVNDERQLERGFCLYLVVHFPGKDFSLTLVAKGIIDEFPTLALIFPALNWSEREAQDLFGLQAVGHPDPRSLVLHPGWPEGFYPLRKDYTVGKECKQFKRAPLVFPEMHGEGIFQVSVGPIHAGVIEALQWMWITMAKTHYALRLDPKLYDSLERWGADEFRSVNTHIEFLLRRLSDMLDS